MGGNMYWWEELEEDDGPQSWEDLTPEEVEDRVEEASAFVSVLEELQPVHSASYNAFAEVWWRLCRVPPEARVQVGHELEPGALRGLWRASMQRYVLLDSRAAQLLGGFSVLADFPDQPGQVVTYEGWAERWERQAPGRKFRVDVHMQTKFPRANPWLTPNQGQVLATRRRFRLHFFLHPRSGAMHAKLELPLPGLPWMNPWLPLYCRLRPELTLTPLEADAGADMTLEFGPLGAARQQRDAQQRQRAQTRADSSPSVLAASRQELGDQRHKRGYRGYLDEDGDGRAVGPKWGLEPAGVGEELRAWDLPVKSWPEPPDDSMWQPSPFSGTFSDFIRVVGPGMYVGCGYPQAQGGGGMPDKDACMHFLLVRKAP